MPEKIDGFNDVRALPPERRAVHFVRLLAGSICCDGVEDLMISCGVADVVTATERCGEECECAHHGFVDGGMECLRVLV